MGRAQKVRALLLNSEIKSSGKVISLEKEQILVCPHFQWGDTSFLKGFTKELEVVFKESIDTNIGIKGISYLDAHKPKDMKISRLMRRSSFQGRLGRYVDNISRVVSDNSIRLSSHPTDMIRIQANRDSRTQDLVSRTIIGAEIIPIMLPTMKDVPLRQFSRENKQDVLIPSYYPINEAEFYTIYAPMEVMLNEDDILLRMIYNANCDEPYVMALQVKEVLSTVGYSSVLYNKYNVTFYDEELPEEVISIIREANMKRDILGW